MKLKKILYFIISIFFLVSCVEDITLPLKNSTKMLVVEGGITTDTMSHKIMLSLSNDFYDTAKPVAVSAAIITLSDGENNYTLTETDTAGTYRTPVFAAKIGKTYRLDIHCSEGDFWSEASIAYQINPIDSMLIKDNPRRDGYLSLCIFLKDQAEIQNFYMGKVAVNDTLRNDTINRYFYTDDMLFNGRYIDDNFPVYSFKKEPKGERDDYRVLRPNSKVTVLAYGISKDYYNFLIEVNSTSSTNPFMGPPAPPRSNIFPAGKACGFFYVMSATKQSMIYLPEDN